MTTSSAARSIKSCAVRSPAGSGKTERLARRYIDLLGIGCPPERILTITFTEKAAAEMKERIFRILKKEDPKLHCFLKSKILRLRITTIHSFCFSLVRRFALELGLEPDLQALPDPDDLWLNTQYDVLMRIAEQGEHDRGYSSLLELVTAGRMAGWNKLAASFGRFFEKRSSIERARIRAPDPAQLQHLAQELRSSSEGQERIPDYGKLFPAQPDVERTAALAQELKRCQAVFLTSAGQPRIKGGGAEFHDWCVLMREYWKQVLASADLRDFERMFEMFRDRFIREYDRRKEQQGWVDFTDMERLAYHLLTTNEDWSNILLAFDEHTDHVLVDEFQDTSYLQWGIIDKLTEEWRAGEGRRTVWGHDPNCLSSGSCPQTPTIFIVGDDKQSIYLFRNAHAEVFSEAEERLRTWLGPERFASETITSNYRSLARIIDFTNLVFGRLMRPAPADPAWCTRYRPFERRRNNTSAGNVELILTPGTALSQTEQRAAEARLIALRIRSLLGREITFDENERPVPCTYGHITILLRNRTHLGVYERALSEQEIPYLIQHGTGFYQEREVRLLMTLLAVLVDPSDDFNLYALLRSPLFGIPEKTLFFASTRKGNTLFEKLLADQNSEPGVDSLKSPDAELPGVTCLRSAIRQVNRRPLAEIIEEVLTAQQGWSLFWEPQRRANIRKFLQLAENYEADGVHPLRIKATLDNAAVDKKEPKANLDVRAQNAVQIMTIHNAKGLQFPIVFCPILDHDISPDNRDPLLVDEESQDRVVVSYSSNAALRREDPMFQQHWRKQEEEEKRLFYVAVTRARDALFLSGVAPGERPGCPSWLTWLWDVLGIRFENGRYLTKEPEPEASDSIPNPRSGAVSLMNTSDVETLARQARSVSPTQAPSPPAADFTARITEPPRLHVEPVTRDTPEDHRRRSRYPGEDPIAFGVVMHQILERISKSELNPNDRETICKAATRLFAFEKAGLDLRSRYCGQIWEQLAKMDQTGDLKVVLPQPDSYAELPFLLREGNNLYSGRIDRLIVREDTVDVIDYKTFPVCDREFGELTDDYRRQMDIYLSAARELFPGKKPRGFLLFTALPRLCGV